MMVLVSGDRELGDGFGYLHEPRGRVYRFHRPWACDNGAYSGFDAPGFLAMLKACQGQSGCLFVAVPDVVGQWEQTLELWHRWHPVVRSFGFPVALVAQDGIAVSKVPWSEVDAVFIGGSTRFKLGNTARTIAGYAQALGKWVHMGRVNGRKRMLYARDIGVQSVDGSSFSRFPDTVMSNARAWLTAAPEQVPMQGELL